MIKVKTFIMKGSTNPLHHERLDNAINNFIAENNIEVVDIKYSTSLSDQHSWIPSAMLIYKEQG